MADPRLKQITIKTGVVKRLTKEKIIYVKEVEGQKQRIERLKLKGEDEHVIKKEQEVLQECLMMVPDCERRLKKAFGELSELLNNETELKEAKEYEAALIISEDAKAQMV